MNLYRVLHRIEVSKVEYLETTHCFAESYAKVEEILDSYWEAEQQSMSHFPFQYKGIKGITLVEENIPITP